MTTKRAWSYSGNNGPQYWPEIAPAAGGYRQSPIVIRSSHAKLCQTLRDHPLVISYDAEAANKLTNNGRTVQVVVSGSNSTLQGGPLCSDCYQLAQFHFHWGSVNRWGSEHKVDGITYAGELHLVHWNTTKFRSLDEAMSRDDGLCVLAVFLQNGVQHPDLQTLCDLFPEVKYAGQSTEIPGCFQPELLLPDDTRKYWTYHGSLTTPPCYESVRFIVFRNPIHVCKHQLNAFRSMHSCEQCPGSCDCPLADNFRPIMPLYGRTVEASFPQ